MAAESKRARAPTRKAAMLATAGSATRRSAERGKTRQFKQRRQDDHAEMASVGAAKECSAGKDDLAPAGKNWEARQRFKCAA
jgi:hypothetical protein